MVRAVNIDDYAYSRDKKEEAPDLVHIGASSEWWFGLLRRRHVGDFSPPNVLEKTTRSTSSLVKTLMVEGKSTVDLLLSLVHCLFHRYVGT